MSDTNTIAGRPIRGDISHYSDEDLPTQKELDDGFIQWLDEIFAAGATHIRWRQHTPYFCDGDPCHFGVNEFYVKIPGVEADYYDYGYEEEKFVPAYHLDDESPVLAALKKLGWKDIRAYYLALNKHFGDPAEVTATPEGFDVESYDHD